MTEDELLSAAASLGLRLDRRIRSELLSEVDRVREAAARLRELPIDPAASPFAPGSDERS